jgi:translation initiation factor 1
MKKALGCGGTIKEGHLEIQGDKKLRAAQILEKEGYKVRIL